MTERILITGGSGFIGANLTRALLADRQEIYLLLRPGFQRWRLAGLEGQYSPLFADLRDAEAVRQQVAICQPEVVYHLAAHGTMPADGDRTAVLSTCLTGTASLLDALRDCDYRAFVHAGNVKLRYASGLRIEPADIGAAVRAVPDVPLRVARHVVDDRLKEAAAGTAEEYDAIFQQQVGQRHLPLARHVAPALHLHVERRKTGVEFVNG